MMPVEIKTVTKRELRETDVTYERVHLDVSIQEAHLLCSLLGAVGSKVDAEFGVNSYGLYKDLGRAIGYTHRFRIEPVELRKR
jgi:hypothetical protein